MSEDGIIEALLGDADERMVKSIESSAHELGTVRTGRASPGLLDRIVVEYYGVFTPLRQISTIAAPEARMLTVTPYDSSMIKAIEKAISASDLGLHPSNDGALIRLVIPELNEERRRELVRVARQIAEDGRIRLRNIRREAMHDLRELKDAGDAGSDDEHRAEIELQKHTDRRTADLDALLKTKEAEILEV